MTTLATCRARSSVIGLRADLRAVTTGAEIAGRTGRPGVASARGAGASAGRARRGHVARAGAGARAIVGLAAAVDDLAHLLAGLLVALVRDLAEPAGLIRDLGAELRPQLRARLRREQHPEARSEHGAREQSHQERAAAFFPLESIVFVRHVSS